MNNNYRLVIISVSISILGLIILDKIGYKCPIPGQQRHFSVNKLQIPSLWEICNNLIKLVREAP